MGMIVGMATNFFTTSGVISGPVVSRPESHANISFYSPAVTHNHASA